jgi:predicted  nucleic acid-binding Zn-ribbon protein
MKLSALNQFSLVTGEFLLLEQKQFEKEKKMNQLKEQIISFTVELEDKEKTYELLKKKLESERNDFASVEDTLTRKYQQLLSVSYFVGSI